MIPLKEFFAVTFNGRSVSIYRVNADPKAGHPVAEKVDLRGEGSIPVGEKQGNKPMLAICAQLLWYDPGEIRRDLSNVERKGWGACTSWVAGLFLSLPEARHCFRAENHHIGDERWMVSTQAILEAIGKDHPTICIPDSVDFGLVQSASVQG